MTRRTPVLTPQRRAALEFIARNPGATAAELDRACRTARGGHQWIYALADRAVRRGLLRRGISKSGRGVGLEITPAGALLIGAVS